MGIYLQASEIPFFGIIRVYTVLFSDPHKVMKLFLDIGPFMVEYLNLKGSSHQMKHCCLRL